MALDAIVRLPYAVTKSETLEPESSGLCLKEAGESGLQSLCAFLLRMADRRLDSLLIGSTQPDAYSPAGVRFCSLSQGTRAPVRVSGL